MNISRDGTIRWAPGPDQVGVHEVTVWLYDGTRSATTTLDLVVRAHGQSWDTGGVVVVLELTVVLFALIAARMLYLGAGRRRR